MNPLSYIKHALLCTILAGFMKEMNSNEIKTKHPTQFAAPF
jgi:hypothetical protein